MNTYSGLKYIFLFLLIFTLGFATGMNFEQDRKYHAERSVNQ